MNWINKLDAGVITGIEARLEGLWPAGGPLFELKDGFVWGLHPRVRNTLDSCNQVCLVSVVNCNEGEIVGIQQLKYVGARGKHFAGNLNGLLDRHNRFLIRFVGPTPWDKESSQQHQADHASKHFAVHS